MFLVFHQIELDIREGGGALLSERLTINLFKKHTDTRSVPPLQRASRNDFKPLNSPPRNKISELFRPGLDEVRFSPYVEAKVRLVYLWNEPLSARMLPPPKWSVPADLPARWLDGWCHH